MPRQRKSLKTAVNLIREDKYMWCVQRNTGVRAGHAGQDVF